MELRYRKNATPVEFRDVFGRAPLLEYAVDRHWRILRGFDGLKRARYKRLRFSQGFLLSRSGWVVDNVVDINRVLLCT